LAVGGVPVLGIMHLPVTQQRYEGVLGHVSTLNGEPLRVRACDNMAQAILTTSNPDFFSVSDTRALTALRERTAWRIYGGCCMSYGLLAAGRTDIAIDASFKIYDYAPFKPLIEGAGGMLTDWQGRSITLASGADVLAAGDVRRHREALTLIERAMR
jgi:inositol-phosphate phosphatase / L-galactose 1-phosphate phosphatase / histidinol-phosphatase